MATITVEQAQLIAKSPRPEGRLCLAAFLGWESFDEEDDFQTALHLDYLYDSLMFTIGKGFPWNSACKLLTLADGMKEQSIGKPLLESVKLFSNNIKSQIGNASEQNLKTYTGFFFDTFFHHYKLYQRVFTTEQEKMQIKMDLPVNVPIAPFPLKEGKDIAVWEYQKKIEAVEERESQAKNERESMLKKTQTADKAVLAAKQIKVESAPIPLERKELLDIMREVASSHLTATSHVIQHNIRCSMEDISFMLEKSSIPRPHSMGVPPRHKLKNISSTSVKQQATSKTSGGRHSKARSSPKK